MKQATVLWGSAVGAAILLAAVGVLAYARHPGVGTYQLNGILLLPLLGLVLYGLHRVLPVRMQWIAAIAVAPLGGIAYLIWPNEQWWNYGPLTVSPLLALLVARAERNRDERHSERSPAAWHDGPWGPP